MKFKILLKMKMLSLLIPLLFMAGCYFPELHVYTRPLPKAGYGSHYEELDPKVLAGSYEVLNARPGSTAEFRYSFVLCVDGFQGWELSTNCGTREPVRIHRFFKLRILTPSLTRGLTNSHERVFLEFSTRPSLFGRTRYSLAELQFSKEGGLFLLPLYFSREKLFNSNMNFKRKRLGGFGQKDITLIEVENPTRDAEDLIKIMQPQFSKNLVLHPSTEKQNKALLTFAKLNRIHLSRSECEADLVENPH